MEVAVDERGIPIEKNAQGSASAHAPATPCQLCHEHHPVNGQPPWEWCKELDVCAATIDWDMVYGSD